MTGHGTDERIGAGFWRNKLHSHSVPLGTKRRCRNHNIPVGNDALVGLFVSVSDEAIKCAGFQQYPVVWIVDDYTLVGENESDMRAGHACQTRGGEREVVAIAGDMQFDELRDRTVCYRTGCADETERRQSQHKREQGRNSSGVDAADAVHAKAASLTTSGPRPVPIDVSAWLLPGLKDDFPATHDIHLHLAGLDLSLQHHAILLDFVDDRERVPVAMLGG
jgi:hypothetical protein